MSNNLIGATTAIFYVRLSNAAADPVDVQWATRDGSAIGGTDYKPAKGVVTFLPGETEKQIEVLVYGQPVTPAEDKVFFINLSPPSNAVLMDALLTCRIVVDDSGEAPVTQIIVAEGRRGPKGAPGLSAYELAVYMGEFTGTLDEWMEKESNAARAAERAEAAAVAANIASKVFSSPEAGVNPNTGVPVGDYFNVRSPLSTHYVDEYQNFGGSAVPTGKSYPSAKGLMDAQAIAERSAAIAEAAATAATIGAGVFETPDAGVDPVTGVADGAYFNVRSSSDESYVDEYQNVGGVPTPSGKSYPSSAAIAGIAMDLQEAKNLQDAKNIDSFSFDDILTQNEKANSKTTDLSVKLQSVFNDPNIKKIIFKRPYYINQLVTFNRNIEWEFVGDGDFVFGATGKIEGGGTAELIGKLPVAANKYTKSLRVPAGISAGDIICIYNPADFSFSPHRDYYRDGQFAMVADVVNGVATLYDTIYSDYDTTCDVYKVDRKRVTIKNLKFSVNAPTNNVPITIHYAKVGIYGLQSTGSQRYGLILSRCFGGDVISIDVKQFKAVPDGYQYAISISNCQDLNVTGGNASAARHGVTFGSLGSECAVPNRNVIISNMTVMSTSDGFGGADIHGNADNVKYINCTVHHSAIGGKNVSILDSTIYGRGLDGLCSWFGELMGGVVEIKRCKLFASGSGQGGFGFIYAVISQDLREDLFLDIDDVTISAPNSTDLTQLINVTVKNDLQITKRINVSINNIKGFDLPALRSVLRFQFGSSGSTTKIPVGSVIVDNIKGLPESRLVFTTDDWDAGYDLKLMKQVGSQVINTGDGARALQAGVTTYFKYVYPTVPKLTMSVSTVDGTWNSAFSAVPISAVATLRANYIAPAIQATSAMPADKNITVGWEVGV